MKIHGERNVEIENALKHQNEELRAMLDDLRVELIETVGYTLQQSTDHKQESEASIKSIQQVISEIHQNALENNEEVRNILQSKFDDLNKRITTLMVLGGIIIGGIILIFSLLV